MRGLTFLRVNFLIESNIYSNETFFTKTKGQEFVSFVLSFCILHTLSSPFCHSAEYIGTEKSPDLGINRSLLLIFLPFMVERQRGLFQLDLFYIA